MSLCAHELSIGYAANTLVKHVHFELKAGEVFCLLGPNGCGKSTLIKTLLNLIVPCAGEVRVNN
jgi:iron complex transport system ATP-binding protein